MSPAARRRRVLLVALLVVGLGWLAGCETRGYEDDHDVRSPYHGVDAGPSAFTEDLYGPPR